MRLPELNELAPADAEALLRPCLDVDRWVSGIVDGRPYPNRSALLSAAGSVAAPLTEAEVAAALAHHPRLGELAEGTTREASMSRTEQAGLRGDAVAARLAEGNRAYEQRFGRVFLIRAAGRTPEEVLAQLQQRLTNDDETEAAVVAAELRHIALLRLEGLVEP